MCCRLLLYVHTNRCLVFLVYYPQDKVFHPGLVQKMRKHKHITLRKFADRNKRHGGGGVSLLQTKVLVGLSCETYFLILHTQMSTT